MRKLALLLLLPLMSLSLCAQELDAKVTVNAQKIEGTNTAVFEALQEALKEFINTRQWTNLQFRPNERISCSFSITIEKYDDATGDATASLMVQSSRPVYNSAYTTTVFSTNDPNFSFNYREFDQLEFNADVIDKDLTALIAYYAYLHREDIKLSKLASESVRKLKSLIAERKSLVVEIARCKAQLKEAGENAPSPGTVKRTEALQLFLESQVEAIEDEMAQTIETDEQMRTNYNLLLSVDGIGVVNAINTIIATHNFEMFDNARQYASYIGVAPFEHTSGTSVRGRTHVEPGAKMLKADLTGAVRSCINHDKEIRKYYERKIAEGKAYGVVANAIKFKLLLRMFAVIKRGTPFVRKPDFIYS